MRPSSPAHPAPPRSSGAQQELPPPDRPAPSRLVPRPGPGPPPHPSMRRRGSHLRLCRTRRTSGRPPPTRRLEWSRRTQASGTPSRLVYTGAGSACVSRAGARRGHICVVNERSHFKGDDTYLEKNNHIYNYNLTLKQGVMCISKKKSIVGLID